MRAQQRLLSLAARLAYLLSMRTLIPLLAAATIGFSAPASALTHHGWDQAGSVARDGLVFVAFGLPTINGDWRGVEQAGLSMGAAFGITGGLKYAISERRPDGSDNKSFPSGHTSVSFAAAATIERRYGWQLGLPAHIVAAFVGVSRIEAKKHFVADVLVGAAIGEAAGWLLTSRRDAAVHWMPWGDAHGGGAGVKVRF